MQGGVGAEVLGMRTIYLLLELVEVVRDPHSELSWKSGSRSVGELK